MKTALPLVLGIILLSGCASNLCIDNISFENKSIPLDDRPETDDMVKTVDHSISVGGEVHVLKAYVDGEQYYLQFHPTRSFDKPLYGPYEGDPEADLACG